MTRLLVSELSRTLARRLFRWLTALSVLGLVLAGVLVYVNTDPGEFRFVEMVDYIEAMAFPMVMLGWVIGASFIGAEWPRRTLSALLTWEPRRTRVLVAKLVAACVYAVCLAALLLAVFTAVMLPSAGSTFGDVYSGWWGDYAVVAGRVGFVTLVGAAIGFGLAAIGKNTGAALGGGLAYLLVVENLVRVFKPSWSEWLLTENIFLIFEDELSSFAGRSGGTAAVTLIAYSAALFLGALGLFRRREIA